MAKFKLLTTIFWLFALNLFAVAQNANVPVAVGDPATQEAPPANSTVRGRVFYESTGRPVRRASITLMSPSASGREPTVLTDNNGNFQIKDVAAGTYYAFVNAPGVVSPIAYADLSADKDPGFGEAVENFDPIVVNGINDVEVQVSAKQGGAISGRITYADGDPAIGVKVEVLRRAADRYLPVISNLASIFSLFGGGGFQTDDRGVYRFSGLPPGEYIVRATENVLHGDYNSRPRDMFLGTMFGGSSLVTLYYPDVFETEKARVINIVPGQEMYEINLTIPDRALFQVAGKIVSGKDRSPADGAKIAIKRRGENAVSIFGEMNRSEHSSSSDSEGNWNFTELPPGDYQLTVEPNNSIWDYDGEDVPPSPANASKADRSAGPRPPKFAKKTQELTITDKDISELVIELGYGATISGTVFVENQKEMPRDVTISVSGEDKGLDTRTSVGNYSEAAAPKPAKINHDFKLENIAVGKFRLSVQIDDESFYVKSATLNNADILSGPIELKEGDNLKNIRVLLADDVGTVKGKVQDANKLPGRNKKFVLVPVNPNRRRVATFYRTVRSNENGEFAVKAAPDEYAVVAFDERSAAKNTEAFYTWLDEVINDAQKVTVTSGETSAVTFTIR